MMLELEFTSTTNPPAHHDTQSPYFNSVEYVRKLCKTFQQSCASPLCGIYQRTVNNFLVYFTRIFRTFEPGGCNMCYIYQHTFSHDTSSSSSEHSWHHTYSRRLMGQKVLQCHPFARLRHLLQKKKKQHHIFTGKREREGDEQTVMPLNFNLSSSLQEQHHHIACHASHSTYTHIPLLFAEFSLSLYPQVSITFDPGTYRGYVIFS